MGKRSDFDKMPRDLYKTPYKAVLPLFPFLENNHFIEPCAGDGRLIHHLMAGGLKCLGAFDIKPLKKYDESIRVIAKRDAMTLTKADIPARGLIVTNPPWSKKILHPMIEHFMELAPTWLLLNADWMHNAGSAPFIPHCEKIVTIGRVKWIENSDAAGKENCCWYKFRKGHDDGPRFYNTRKLERKKENG